MTTRLPPAAVLLVRHSGPLFAMHDVEVGLMDRKLSSQTLHAANISATLPSCRVLVQLGMGENPSSGFELLARLRSLAPITPIVVCSGHTAETMSTAVRECAGAEFIHRPLLADHRFLDELALVIQRLIADTCAS